MQPAQQWWRLLRVLSRSNYSPHVSFGGGLRRGKGKLHAQGRSGEAGAPRRASGAAFSPAYNLQKSRTMGRARSSKRQSMVSIISGPTGMYTEHIAWARSPTFQKPKASAVGGVAAAAAAAATAAGGGVGAEGTPTYPTASWTEKRPLTTGGAEPS